MVSERFLELYELDKENKVRSTAHREELKNLLSRLVRNGKPLNLPKNNLAYGTIFQPTVRSPSLIKDEYLAPPNDLPAFFNPRLECIIVKMAINEDISAIVGKFGSNWITETVDAEQSLYDFDLLPLKDVTIQQAWNFVHELRDDPHVVLAEPSWEIDAIAEETRPPETRFSPTALQKSIDQSVQNKFWAPELIRIQQAWELNLPKGGRVHGEGIRIAHPDTGHSHRHTNLVRPGAVDIDAGFDFVGDDSSVFEDSDLTGVGTESVMMSGTEGDILGVAPKVSLIPMRVAQKGLFARPAPLLLRSGMRRLRKAIDMAIKTDCHIISISHGWLGHSALHAVIQQAWKNNIIIIASAGNYSGSFITAPAKYRESICVAGCNADHEIWKGSARGSRVDICGPAQDVWKAGYLQNEAIPMQSSSNSFATALTAGVAALWLAYHGRDNLINRYDAHDIPLGEVFRVILKQSADPSPGVGFGGILNAEKVLEMPLPEPDEVLKAFEWEALTADPSEIPQPSLATTLEIMGDNYKSSRQLLARSLDIPENQLERSAMNCGDELAFHMLLATARSGSSNQSNQCSANLELSVFSNKLRRQISERNGIENSLFLQ